MYLQLKKLARTKRPLPATVKCRLAGRLGIGLPQAGRQIPTMVKSPSLSGFVESRAMSSDIGTSGLSIMGNRDDLDPFRSAAYSLYVNFRCSKSNAFLFSCKQAIEVCILLGCIARTMYVDVAYCYRPISMVCWFVTLVSPAKTAEPIEMLFGSRTPVGPWNHVLDAGPYSPMRGGNFEGGRGGPLLRIWTLRLSVQKRLN